MDFPFSTLESSPQRRITHKRARLYPRTRNGCLTCRRRKKKCDEAKPRCVACTRNQLDCSWPPPRIQERASTKSNEQDSPLQEVGEGDLSRPLENHVPSVPPSPLAAELECSSVDASGIADDSVVVWHNDLGSFLSPRRAGMLLPASKVLLSHYLAETGSLLVTAPAQNNPFVSWVMAIAYNDDLLMHSILALSGSHLSFKLEGNIEIQQATAQHYSLVLRTLQYIVVDAAMLNDPDMIMRLLLMMMVLCHYEVLSGNLNGSLFTHLRASRKLILQLLDKQQEIITEDNKTICGFILELYSYIVLANMITPYGMIQGRTLIYDPLLLSLEGMSGFWPFGVMFGGSHGLFEMISQVSLFAAQQQPMEESRGEPPIERVRTRNNLKVCITNWTPPVVESSDGDWLLERKEALETCRYALLIFLETAVSPISVHDEEKICRVQALADVAVSYLKTNSSSNYDCIKMWPLMIIGSCLVQEDQRKYLSYLLLHNRYKMRNTTLANWVLELLWNDCDPYAFGPYGLGLVMEKHGISYGVI